MKQCERLLAEQLAVDYDCTLDEVMGDQHVFRPWTVREGARRIGCDGAIFRAAAYRGKLLVMAEPCMLDWCRQHMKSLDAAWLSEPETLWQLNTELNRHGQHLADAHHHYLPLGLPQLPHRHWPLRWYQQAELEQFRGDGRFYEALLFDPQRPDLLAVCALDGEKILGMASVTRNCRKLWEIGVNVTKESQDCGVASYLTALLSERVEQMGAVPTWATAESHIASQRVALKAGFLPVMYEIYSARNG